MDDTSETRDRRAGLGEDEPWDGNLFVSTYPPFSRWSADELPRVEEVLDRVDERARATPLGLYVHVPFCEQRCHFCYYLSSVDAALDRVDGYVDLVARELEDVGRRPYLAGRAPSFVYFGGGTPSMLAPGQIEALVGRLRAVLPWTDVEEVTFECAPRSATGDRLRVLRDLGVTRLSIGAQQLDDDVLHANGRIHGVRDVTRAVEAARAVGFEVLNIDLIVGLVGETDGTFDRGLERTLALSPDSVTVYQLEIPRNTPLHRAVEDPAVELVPWSMKRARLLRAFSRLEAAGFTLRSAYAAGRDDVSRRFVYQDAQYAGADLLGLGASSFSYLGGVHFQNLASPDAYEAAIRAGAPPRSRAHRLSEDERLVREFVLQLKLGRVEIAALEAKFGVDVRERFAVPLEALARRGWLSVDEGVVSLTRAGLVRADRLLRAFYLPEHRHVPYC